MGEYIRSGSKIEGHYRKAKWIKAYRRKATIVNKQYRVVPKGTGC